MSQCVAPDCEREANAKSLCMKHYMRKRKHGDVTVRIIRSSHGMYKKPIYYTWSAMISRCTNSNHPDYNNYGGRGISVCDRWRYSFANFYEDVGDRPSPELSIDRINNDGNYEPGNVKWSTRKEQSNNQRPRRKRK